MKYDPKTAFGNAELIQDMKARNKRLKASRGKKLCDRCARVVKQCICLTKAR